MMPLKDGSVEVRLGRGDFSKCTLFEGGDKAAEGAGGDAYDCPPGEPSFRSFPGTKAADNALAAVTELSVLAKARTQFGESSDKPVVQAYHRGEALSAAEGRKMLECLTGVCRDAVLKDELDQAVANVDAQMAAKAKSKSASKKGKKIAVDEDPAAAEEKRLRLKSVVNKGDLKRMAMLQNALGTVRLPTPKVNAAPGRTAQLDVKAAAKVIERGQRGITACVSRAMTRGQSMYGELRARISIQPTGRVATTEVLTEAYKGSEVARCIVKKVKRWRFPSFPGKELVPVEVPWKLPKR